MKYKLCSTLIAGILFLMSGNIFAQTPTLGNTSRFVLFTTAGAITNSGIPNLTHLTGDVGSNIGLSTGFGNVDGGMHDGDVASVNCTADLMLLYGQLNSATATFSPVLPVLGNGDTLVAGVYQYPLLTAATLNLNLILNASGDPNALFIIKIDGAFSANASSKVILANGALACNVFWVVEGLVSIASGTTMRGTIVSHNAAIVMSSLDTLEGRALSINGNVSTNALLAYTPIGCGSPTLTGSVAPVLSSTVGYALFSNSGSVVNLSVNYIIGDVGTNSGSATGFNPLFVTGTIHPIPDASTALCTTDLNNVYDYLNALPADIKLLYPAQFGNNLVLTPHNYLLDSAALLTGNIYLNAQGNPNAVFVIHINGAFTTTSLSHVILRNGTKAKNVYWLINGAVHVYDNSLFNGTIVATGAITFNLGDTLYGRAMTKAGLVLFNGKYINITPPPCVAPPITGSHSVCQGAAISLADVDTGGTWVSSNTTVSIVGSASGIVMGITPGNDTITYTSLLACVNTFTVTVNATPAPITGLDSVCAGATIILTDAVTGGTWSSSNTLKATIGSVSGIVTGIAAGTATITYLTGAGCMATKAITVNAAANPGTISGPSSVCVGSTITLTDAAAGGTWSSSNSNATVFGGIVTGVTAGIDTIRYAITNFCGTAIAVKYITVNPLPNAGFILGLPSVCVGATISLTVGIPGGVWSSSNGSASVLGGIVTGVIAGIDTIKYAITNVCGIALAAKAVTINSLPNSGIILGLSSVCVGATITLTDGVTGGVWSSSNGSASVSGGIVTGVIAGIDTIRYAITNVCGTAIATKRITVNPLPNAGTILGLSSVCVGATITLTDGVTGGAWNSSNGSASVSGGIVTGITAGIDTIRYTITNICGTAIATKTITVNPMPYAGGISGPSSVCIGSSITLTDGATGGIWNSIIGMVSVSGGVVTGLYAGNDTITYTVTNICGTDIAMFPVIVVPFPLAGSITGASSVCVSSIITLTDTMTGGVWLCSNSSAIIFGGIVIGVSAGTDTILYIVSNSCGADTAAHSIAIIPFSVAGTITGGNSVCVGSADTLTATVSGGIWSSSGGAATVGATDGIVYGVASGTASISYTVANACNTAIANHAVTVNPLPSVGPITGPDTVCIGDTLLLGNSITGGIWAVTNGNAMVSATGVVTGLYSGIDTISYTVTTAICGSAKATYLINILPLGSCNTSVLQINDIDIFLVYPNPNNGMFNVILSSNIYEPMKVLITNIIGEKIKEFTTSTNKLTEVNLNGITSGIYYLYTITAHGRYSTKVNLE